MKKIYSTADVKKIVKNASGRDAYEIMKNAINYRRNQITRAAIVKAAREYFAN